MAVDWDDLRFVHAVATEGSLAAAGRALGVNHTTVLRRIAGLEARLGQPLFDRRREGYRPTPRVAALLGETGAIERAVRVLDRELAGGDLRLEGTVRLTCADTVALLLLPGILAAFRAAHPGITVELVVVNTPVDLARSEADVALRQTAAPPETLYGRRVGRLAFAWYGAPDLALTLADGVPAAPLAMPDDASDVGLAGQWVRARVPAEAEVAFRASSFLALRDAARAGLGAAFLACYVGESDPGLVRVSPPRFEPACDLWVLTHERVRRVPRIRTLTEFLAQAVPRYADLLEGRTGPVH